MNGREKCIIGKTHKCETYKLAFYIYNKYKSQYKNIQRKTSYYFYLINEKT